MSACEDGVTAEAGFSDHADGFLGDDLLVVSQMQQTPFGVSDLDLAGLGADSAAPEVQPRLPGGGDAGGDLPPVDRLSLSTSCSPEHAEASGFSKPSSGDPLAALVAEDSPSDCPPRPLSSPAAEAALFPEANLQRPQLSPKQTQGGGGAEARRESSGRDASQREIERRQREEEELRREVRELAKKEIEEFYERRSRQIQAMQEHRQKGKAAASAATEEGEAEGEVAGPWGKVLRLVDASNQGSAGAAAGVSSNAIQSPTATRPSSSWGNSAAKPGVQPSTSEHQKMRQLLQQMAEEEVQRASQRS